MSPCPSELKPAASLLPRLVAFGLWGAFVLLCVGMAVNQGLCCADDGWYAGVAKSLAKGLGYATTFTDRGECLEPVVFNPWTGTGPGLLVPCAAVLKIAGINDAVPGIAAIIVWAGIFTMLLFLISREVRGWSLPLGVALFCLAIVSLFAFSFSMWSVCLGEIPAVAYLALAHWLVAMGKSPRRSLFFSGLFWGLAFQTKNLALLAGTGLLFIVAVRLYAAGGGRKTSIVHAACFILGGVIPTFLFEAWKVVVLGFHGWLLNWRQFLAAVQEMTVKKPPQLTWEVLQHRLELVDSHYSVHLFTLLVVVVVVFYLLRFHSAKPWSYLFAGLVISVVVSSGYWLFCSVGWPRYLALAAGLSCFALSVPVYGLAQTWKKLLFSVLVLILLSRGLVAFSAQGARIEKSFFQPSQQRLAREQVVAVIRDLQQQGPVTLVSRHWTEFADVEFALSSSMNFNQLNIHRAAGARPPRVAGLPGKKVALINRRWGAAYRAGHPVDERADLEALMEEKITRVLLSVGPFELLETAGPVATATNALAMEWQTDAGKLIGAHISAAPNPVPEGRGGGLTKISWNTGDGSSGGIYLSENGGAEKLFTRGVKGTKEVPWINAGSVYEFRLYQGTERTNLLAAVRVIRRSQGAVRVIP